MGLKKLQAGTGNRWLTGNPNLSQQLSLLKKDVISRDVLKTPALSYIQLNYLAYIILLTLCAHRVCLVTSASLHPKPLPTQSSLPDSWIPPMPHIVDSCQLYFFLRDFPLHTDGSVALESVFLSVAYSHTIRAGWGLCQCSFFLVLLLLLLSLISLHGYDVKT